jgi:hypothetical protein
MPDETSLTAAFASSTVLLGIIGIVREAMARREKRALVRQRAEAAEQAHENKIEGEFLRFLRAELAEMRAENIKLAERIAILENEGKRLHDLTRDCLVTGRAMLGVIVAHERTMRADGTVFEPMAEVLQKQWAALEGKA